MSARWSGYASQSEAWRHGYDWARSEGPYGEGSNFDAIEALGYDFVGPESDDFDKGSEFALGEMGR